MSDKGSDLDIFRRSCREEIANRTTHERTAAPRLAGTASPGARQKTLLGLPVPPAPPQRVTSAPPPAPGRPTPAPPMRSAAPPPPPMKQTPGGAFRRRRCRRSPPPAPMRREEETPLVPVDGALLAKNSPRHRLGRRRRSDSGLRSRQRGRPAFVPAQRAARARGRCAAARPHALARSAAHVAHRVHARTDDRAQRSSAVAAAATRRAGKRSRVRDRLERAERDLDLPFARSRNTMLIAAAIAFAVVVAGVVFLMLPKDGSLVVTVAGPGNTPVTDLEVIVDGKKRCSSSPCRVEALSSGTHLVRVARRGLRAHRRPGREGRVR